MVMVTTLLVVTPYVGGATTEEVELSTEAMEVVVVGSSVVTGASVVVGTEVVAGGAEVVVVGAPPGTVIVTPALAQRT